MKSSRIGGMVLLCGLFGGLEASAEILGLTGTEFSFTAKRANISGGDGLTIRAWGYANGNGRMQYPGPTLIVNQGDEIVVHLKCSNLLPEPVSIVFPGQANVRAAGGKPGLLTREAPPDGVTEVVYTFTAQNAGTYFYHSGTHPDLQVEMGLFGALIVRPTGFNPADPRAYDHPFTAYDHEYLLLMSEMDYHIHQQVAAGQLASVNSNGFWPVYWFLNGRNAPDTMLMPDTPWLPYQPYNCMPRMHPGERILIRFINAGRDLHPLHTHSNDFLVLAIDGRVLASGDPYGGVDLAWNDFTLQAVPGSTADAIFQWTGAGLNWDIYGHAPGDQPEPNEYMPDHGKPIPVILPEQQELFFGGMWSGSPFLGTFGDLPPGEGGDNANAGFYHMWHSHNDKEMVNNDIFPGGMMTMLVIEPPGVPIP